MKCLLLKSTLEIIPKVINSSNEKLFNPFEVNEEKYDFPLYEIDPDINCYNTIGSRSIRANVSSFEICLENMEYDFSVIGLSETWLRDYNCKI